MVFVATHPEEHGQVIVGWYRAAVVLRGRVKKSPGKPRGYGYYCWAEASNCVLLPHEGETFSPSQRRTPRVGLPPPLKQRLLALKVRDARTPQERTAIEDHAMAAATQYFEAKRFVVKDVHLSRPYDLLCRRSESELHVEVKGTTTDGDKVILTNNEVKHACDPGSSCVLFVVHSIILQGQRATGGKLVLLDPWQLQQAHLTPTAFADVVQAEDS